MDFTPKDPESMIGTFGLILVFTMLKELYEDRQRMKSDVELNNSFTQRLDPLSGRCTRIQWQEIKEGDIIKVQKNEEVPADLLICNAPKDIVFVSTMNLDGETNLKEKVWELREIDSLHKLCKFQGKVEIDPPNSNLEKWKGNIFSSSLERVTNLEIRHLLLRGCTLRNTEYVFGVAMYLGVETKIL